MAGRAGRERAGALTSEAYRALTRRGNKYGAVRCEEDGYKFASKAERAEYRRLKLRVLAGEITNLEMQPRYPLVVNRIVLGHYVADFRHRELDGTLVVTDVKGGKATATPVFRLKAKLMLALYDIDIRIVG